MKKRKWYLLQGPVNGKFRVYFYSEEDGKIKVVHRHPDLGVAFQIRNQMNREAGWNIDAKGKRVEKALR